MTQWNDLFHLMKTDMDLDCPEDYQLDDYMEVWQVAAFGLFVLDNADAYDRDVRRLLEAFLTSSVREAWFREKKGGIDASGIE